jgi:hypothetical protein
MRTLLAIAVALAGTAALPLAADARKATYRATPPPYYYAQPRYYQPRYDYRQPRYYSSEQAECERRAEAEDPAGQYAGYPCWARSTFGRGSSGGRR